MNEFEQMLANALAEDVNGQYGEFFGNDTKHRFSRAYKKRRKMNILSAEKTRGGVPIPPAPRFSIPKMTGIPLKKRVTIVSIAVMMAIGVSAGAGASLAVGMKKVAKTKIDFLLKAVDMENCPETIECIYYLSEIPDGFYLEEFDNEIISEVSTWYKNTNGYDFILFMQDTKKGNSFYDNEHISSIEDVTVGDKYGVFMTWEKTTRLVWDNGDYVLEISSRLPKEEAIELAKSAKVCENIKILSK